MKLASLAAAVLVLNGCHLHLHVHGVPEPDAPVAAREAATAATPAPARGRSVAGVVLDVEGRPVRARVAAVGEGGSVSMGTSDDGRFDLDVRYWEECTLHGSTEDARQGFLADVRGGTRGLTLVVEPGATLTVDLEGLESTRCAVFRGDTRIEDFTLRAGAPARVVVPAGELVLRLYDGDDVHAERALRVAQGAHEDVTLSVDA